MPEGAREIAPREALLEAIVTYDNERVRAMFSEQALEAMSLAIGQDATKDEIRRALVTQDGKTTSLLMTACSIGNYEAVRNFLPRHECVEFRKLTFKFRWKCYFKRAPQWTQ